MDATEAPVSSASVVRAWLVAHDARVVGAAMAAGTLVLCVGAQWLLPVPGQERKVPFWQLTPALLAMLASLATVNRLPSGRGWAQLAARGAWVGLVMTAAAASAWAVGQGTGLPSLVPGTAVVVGLTFAAAPVVGRWSVWVGAMLAVEVLMRMTRTAADEDLWTSLPPTGQLVLAAMATAGVAAYAALGADGARMPRSGRMP